MALPTLLLRIEGLALAASSLALYPRIHETWWLFVLIIVPDLGLIALGTDYRTGAVIYDVLHTTTVPIVLGVAGILIGNHVMTGLALIWTTHIGVDHVLGYGLRDPARPGWTHLGRTRVGAGNG